MATANHKHCIGEIGETAGDIWQTLSTKGPLPLAKLIKEVAAPRDVVMQGLGWLAREDKVSIEEESRRKVVALK